jgi:hypothetical protein
VSLLYLHLRNGETRAVNDLDHCKIEDGRFAGYNREG